MNLRHESGAQTPAAGLESVHSRATLQPNRFRSALAAPVFWKTGLPPGLSRSRDVKAPLVAHARAPRESGRPMESMGRSSRDLLEPLLTAPADDHNASILGGPEHLARDPRLTDKRAVAIPHRRLHRIGQLIARRPHLDINRLAVLKPREPNRGRLAAAPGAPRERHDRDNRAAPLELIPHVRPPEKLRTPRPQPRRVHPGGLPPRRSPAPLAGVRLTCRASTRAPTTRDVKPQKRNRPRGLSKPSPPPLTTARSRRRATLRAPLLEPAKPVAHARPLFRRERAA